MQIFYIKWHGKENVNGSVAFFSYATSTLSHFHIKKRVEV